jgi:hypothetical protein
MSDVKSGAKNIVLNMKDLLINTFITRVNELFILACANFTLS